MTPYSKLNSQGNDFILIEKHLIDTELTKDLIKKYCSRDNIGCDQFFIIDTTDKKNIKCDVYNQDGSEACQCGNGLRATMLYLNKKYNLDSTNIIICDKAYNAKINNDLISINMGTPKLIEYPENNNKELHLLNDGIATYVDSKSNNLKFSFISLSIGNEHSVVFSKNCLDNKDIISETIESIFGYEMNIGFIENAEEYLNDNKTIVNLSVNERGSGYTASCGSGATAAAICLFSLSDSVKEEDVISSKIIINQRGGLLEVIKNYNLNSFDLVGPSSFDGEGYLE